jgi:SAM-dependent methyltransferase
MTARLANRSAAGGPARAAIRALLRAAPSLTPRVEKALWRSFYQLSSRRRGNPGTAFMNYGYASLDDDEPDEGNRSNDPDRFPRQLYARVAGAADLAQKDVLEVGCGRGGGTAFVFEQFRPRSMTGIDLAPSAVARCRAEHERPGLAFAAGDAEALPFPDDTFDVVLNLESSHCYPDVPRFLEEVRRVLRPGGLLLLADFRHTVLPEGAEDALVPQEDVSRLREQLMAAGYRTVEEEDLTPNVVEALRLDSPNRRARLERRVPKLLRSHVLAFAAVEGGGMYAAFAQGNWTYLRFVLRVAENGRRQA